MKEYKTNIEVIISNVEVEETDKNRGWYQFDYSISINGKKPKRGMYDGTWSSQTKKEFETVLKKSWAVQCVMQRFS